MAVYKKIAYVSAAFAMSAGAALADEVRLTAAEQATVVDACRVGMPLIPVESDYGYATEEYALPLAEENGDVHSALILSAAVLKDIPECKAEVESLAAQRGESNDRIS